MKYEVIYTVKNIYKIEVEAESREAAWEIAEDEWCGDSSILDMPDDQIIDSYMVEEV